MFKETKRAQRRADKRRMKAKAKRVYHFCSPQQAAKYADNLKVCSCWACGNRRQYEGSTLQERKHLQD